MISLYTTEENLIQMCREAGFWFDIVSKLKCVHLSTSSNNEEWNVGNDVLLALHRSGIMLEVNNELEKSILEDHSKVYTLPNPVYLLNIEKEEAKKIEKEYGVICRPIEERNDVALVEQGWEFDTADESKIQSWKSFFSGTHAPLNAIVIIDRYFFASAKNKTNSSLNETIDDSFSNLRQLLEMLLPKESKDEVITVAIIYDHSTVNRDEVESFAKLMRNVHRIKRTISRSYVFTVELISLTSDCYQYDETHDRFIITNYFFVNATHKIKAFREGNVSLKNQRIYFRYLFSMGIKPGDKSSMPMVTQDRVLSAIRESLSVKNVVQHGCNGQTSKIGEFTIKNRLLQ